jgi:hypothetical protein
MTHITQPLPLSVQALGPDCSRGVDEHVASMTRPLSSTTASRPARRLDAVHPALQPDLDVVVEQGPRDP